MKILVKGEKKKTLGFCNVCSTNCFNRCATQCAYQTH